MKRSADNRPLLGLFRILTFVIMAVYLTAVVHLWFQNLYDARVSLTYINSMLTQGVRTTLKGHELILRGLGQELVSLGALDEPERGRTLIARMQSIDPGMAGFGLARPDGQLVLVSRIGPGQPLPNLAKIPQSRDSFPEVLESQQLRTGRPYHFASLGRWVVPIRVPILDPSGELLAVMTAGYAIEDSTTAWAHMTLPPQVSAGLMRDDGHTLYQQPLPEGPRMEALKDVYGEPAEDGALQLAAALNPNAGFLPVTNPHTGSVDYVAYAPIPEYGLHAGAFIPRSAVISGWLHKLVAPTLLLLMFLIGGILAYRRASQQQAASDAEIRQLTAWQQAMLDGAEYSIISTDTRGTIVSFNRTAQRMLGYASHELVGRQTLGVFHDPLEMQHYAAELSEQLGETVAPGFEVFTAKARRGQIEEREWTYIRKDGSRFPGHLSVSPLSAADGDIIGFVGITADRSELASSRQALIERNDSLRLLNQLSQRLHGTLELDDILRETVQTLVGLDHTPHVAIYLLNPDQTRLQLADSHGFERAAESLPATAPIKGSLTELALTKGAPLVHSDIANAGQAYSEFQAALGAGGAESGIVIPMIYQGEPLGSIILVFEQEHEFVETGRETLLSLSNTVALAITNARQMDNLEYQARHDNLTGLPNRALLHETFVQQIGQIDAAGGRATLMLLDLDRFKEINDTLGHHVGDRVLSQIGPRLQQACAGSRALISRLGGDEFAIFFDEEKAAASAVDSAKAIVEALRQPFVVEGVDLRIGASIGVAYYPDHGKDSHALLRAADVAMYQAKKLSAGIMVYDSSFDDYSAERLALANELVQAIQLGQLILHYQPKIDINSGQALGFEALVRWQHPRLGLLYPGAFIELVEMSEVIHPFTRAVIDLAVADKRRLSDLGYGQPVAINLSANNLIDASCFSNLVEAIAVHDLPAAEVELELTETALMHDQDNATALLNQFNDLGINIAIDDFGTGYSSLSYLRQLPIKALKIDRSFVTHMLTDRQDSTIVRSTIALAHNLSLDVIAEGVEDAETLAMLRAMGCDQAQGFGLCRPQPLEQLIAWLGENDPPEAIRQGS